MGLVISLVAMLLGAVLEAFETPFMQRAAFEVLLLAPAAGLLGAQIVLHRLAFFTHAVGTAAFPGLVLAGAWGAPAAPLALAAAGAFGLLERALAALGRLRRDAATALALLAALALGTILASDVFASGGEVDRLLFGSLLAIGTEELAATACGLAAVGALALVWHRAWIASAFDPSSAAAPRGRGHGAALATAIAVAAVVSIDAVGALLVSALLVLPAAAARPFARSVRTLGLAAACLAALEGLAGLWLAWELDVPPGAAIALLGGIAFACAQSLSALRGAPGRAAA